MFFFFQAEDGIRDAQESRWLGDVYMRQVRICPTEHIIDSNLCLTKQINRPSQFVATPSSIIMSTGADGSVCAWDLLAAVDKFRLEAFIQKERGGFASVRARGALAAEDAEREAAQRQLENQERVRTENKIIEEMAEEKAAHENAAQELERPPE
eukprot:TRINITY_DN41040_c0_g1_i1.p1 TRINITY_DN41040_c0_g1~~TRINITY_DN41040_c0_g1_i1.p1  ORF type:complete len:154 (+),score=55.86 TRINITY_DN41040_c0_g1_i1:104-565(+)